MEIKTKVFQSKTTLLFIMVVMFLVSSNLNWTRDNWKKIIEVDAKGYYAYLPAIFIYQDLNFGFYDQLEGDKYYDKDLYYDYRYRVGDKFVNRYFCGTAIAQLPFFLVAHILSLGLGLDADGYSKIYPIMIHIGALFYLFLGLWYLRLSMSGYQINENSQSWVLLATVFGTNLFYYAAVEPGMSHVYSFGLLSMFFYYTQLYFDRLCPNYILLLSALLGGVILIRPVNGLVVCSLPMAARTFEKLKKGISIAFKDYNYLLGGIMICLGIISIQGVIYKLSTGSFWVYSYGDAKFNWTSPQIMAILLSYKKGLFLYTPMYLLAFVGVYYLWKKYPFAAYTWIVFFAVITYVFSCWFMWYYGGSFSSRVYIEYLPFFMLLLAIALQNASYRVVKWGLKGLIFGFIILCQIQTYQYRYYQIHWEDMTKERYWDVFLRIDKIINQ